MANTVRLLLRISAPWKATYQHVNKVNLQHFRNFSIASRLFTDKIYKFSDKHEWVTKEGNIGTIGISDYAQDKLGEVVYFQPPDMDQDLAKDDECGVLESVKAASDLFIPVAGRITEINKDVVETPNIINKSCYEKGWLFKVELTNPGEIDSLMDETSYKAFLKSEEGE